MEISESEIEYPFFARVIAAALIALLVLLPVGRVYADEGEVPAPEVLVEEVPPVAEEVVPEPVVEEVVPEPEPLNDSSDESSGEPEPVATTTESVPEEVLVPEPEQIATTTESIPEPEPEPLNDSQSESSGEPELVSVPEPEPVYDEVSSVTPAAIQAYTSSQVVFQPDECTTVDDGAFYCIRKSTEAEDSGVVHEAKEVYVAKDGDGDTEIFFREGSITKRLSDNVFDDDAPVLDTETGRVVWHGNVNDRYQIFLYDPQSGVRQLTDGPTNSQHPALDGDRVVYQTWNDENWEVFLVDLSTGVAEAPRRLSSTGGHDMFPKIYGDFVTWQAREGDLWRAKGFNLTTGEYADLGEGTSGDVESARLVLLVERRDANGDVVRVGYDVDSGDTLPLGTKPAPVPEPVPTPTPYEDPSAIPPPPPTSTTTTPVRDDGPNPDET